MLWFDEKSISNLGMVIGQRIVLGNIPNPSLSKYTCQIQNVKIYFSFPRPKTHLLRLPNDGWKLVNDHEIFEIWLLPNDRRPQGAFIWPPKSESEDQAPLKVLFFDEDMKPKAGLSLIKDGRSYLSPSNLKGQFRSNPAILG